jgi:5'-3' exonuclease
MGIPVYFKTILKKYSNKIIYKGKLDKEINSLFLDLNCLIHPCCRGLTDENEMIQKILHEIDKLIEYTSVTDLLYIAIDGIAPKAKMKQQRMRRYNKYYENKYSADKSWNTNNITPGTFFMNALNDSLKIYSESSKLNIILSDSSERGEGEHKILNYIRNNLNDNINDNLCIYGLDADLIQLSLVSRINNIYLLREKTEYNIENTNEEYIYLNIDLLKKYILDELHLNRILNQDQIIDDTIFLCMMFGNDFINHISSINLRYNGYEYIFDTYKSLQDRYQGYFCLIDRKLKNYLHLSFFTEFIQELSKNEDKYMNNIFNIRKKQLNKITNLYKNNYIDFKTLINDLNIDEKNITIDDIYHIKSKLNSDKFIDNLPLLYSMNEKKIYENTKYDKNICSDYLDSLLWCIHYYFDKCIHWRWCTEYNTAPTCKYLNKYLSTIDSLEIKQYNQEFTHKEQLSFIFPNDSHNLHKYKIKSKEYILKPKLSFNRYLWECHLDFV